MRIELLHVPDCPGTAALVERLDQVLAGRTDVSVDRRVVSDQDEAVALGMTGSPTLRVDGVDPFAGAAPPPGLCCRLYRDEAGALVGAPSIEQLRAALWRFTGTAVRQAGLPAELRRLHQAILAGFLTTGAAPGPSWLDAEAHRLGLAPDAAYARLSTEDLVHLDENGAVDVAYPFSARPIGHRVVLSGGPAVSAMCAVDALGIPQLARRDAVIESADAHTGEPIRVEVERGAWRWSPAGTVVLVAQSGEAGPTSCSGCPHMNFHTDPDTATAYLDSRPGLSGQLLDQPAAVELARHCFAALLDAEAYSSAC